MKHLIFLIAGYFVLLLNIKAIADTPEWFGNDHFRIDHVNQDITVKMEKLPWESFSVVIGRQTNARIYLNVSTQDNLTMQVNGFTDKGEQIVLFRQELNPGADNAIAFDLNLSKAAITQLVFYINPGEAYTGGVVIRDFKVLPNEKQNLGIAIYPNPISDYVHITSATSPIAHLSIMNADGKILFDTSPNQSQVTIRLDGYKPGLYLIKARGAGYEYTSKVVVH